MKCLLNILNLVTKDIQDRIYYIEDVLETQLILDSNRLLAYG